MARVLMMVINPMTADTRVEKEADSLGRLGHEVTVIGTHQAGLPTAEDRGTYTIRRLPYRRVVKERLVERRRTGAAIRSDERHALLAALQNPPRRWRRVSVVATYLHLLVLRFQGLAGRIAWLFGGGILRLARSRILPVEYWRGTVSQVPDVVTRCDVIHAHDLGPLAAAVRLAEQWQRERPDLPRPRVVYDSHEYYVEQNTSWTRLEKRLWALHERRWIKRADAVITVSDGIAGALQRRYRLPDVPTVVYNSPPADAAGAASDVRNDAGVGPSDVLVVYVGGVKPGRGVDRLIPAIALRSDLHLAIIGAGHTSGEHLASVLEQAQHAGVAHRVHVLPPVPAATLSAYISTADVGVHPMEPTCLNHELALPNKLFDYVFAGLPVAVSDLTEMRRFVTEHGVGTTFNPLDPVSTASALSEVADGIEQYRASPEVRSRIVRRYGWPAQHEKLSALYRRLVSESQELAA